MHSNIKKRFCNKFRYIPVSLSVNVTAISVDSLSLDAMRDSRDVTIGSLRQGWFIWYFEVVVNTAFLIGRVRWHITDCFIVAAFVLDSRFSSAIHVWVLFKTRLMRSYWYSTVDFAVRYDFSHSITYKRHNIFNHLSYGIFLNLDIDWLHQVCHTGQCVRAGHRFDIAFRL